MRFYHNAIVESAEVVQVPLKENGQFDLDGILNEIDEDTALVWICNPNNPTGTCSYEFEVSFIYQYRHIARYFF